jgi:hypothetical protein
MFTVTNQPLRLQRHAVTSEIPDSWQNFARLMRGLASYVNVDGLEFVAVHLGFQSLGQRTDDRVVALGNHRRFAENPAQITGASAAVAEFGRVGAWGEQVLGKIASKKTVIIMLFSQVLRGGGMVSMRRNEHTSGVEPRWCPNLNFILQMIRRISHTEGSQIHKSYGSAIQMQK